MGASAQAAGVHKMKIQKIPFEEQLVSNHDALLPASTRSLNRLHRNRSRCRIRSSTCRRSTPVPSTPSATMSPAWDPLVTTPSPSPTT